MLKFIFWSLLCINAALFAFGRGYLGNFKPSEREPQRIARQIGTDKLVLLSAAGASALKPAAPVAPPPVAPVEAATCTEIGHVAERDARRLDKLLEPLDLGEKLSKTEVTVQEISSYMVMIPPLGSKDAADKKAAELKERGVSNYFIMNDSSAAKWAISLGVFKSETAAQTLLAALVKQGVSGAKMVGRPSAATRLAYRFRNIDADAKVKLDAIAAKFDDLDTRSCK
ncbi:MAG: SPOR domain-containing protein [Pseudomonadota bacterium]